MTKIVNVVLYLSDMEWRIIERFGINIVDTCREAVKQEIRDRAEIREICDNTRNIVKENERLRAETIRLKEQILKGINDERAIITRLSLVKP